MRWRTVSGGGRAPEPVGRKRSGRPERSGFLEGNSPCARSRAQAPKGRARRGKNLIRDGFGRTGPARRFSPAARGKWSPRQTMERPMHRAGHKIRTATTPAHGLARAPIRSTARQWRADRMLQTCAVGSGGSAGLPAALHELGPRKVRRMPAARTDQGRLRNGTARRTT